MALPAAPVTARTWTVVWNVPSGTVTDGVRTWMTAGLLLVIVTTNPPACAESGPMSSGTVRDVPWYASAAD